MLSHLIIVYFAEKTWAFMGVFELVPADYKTREVYSYPVIVLNNADSFLDVRADDVHSFIFNHSIKYHNILRKWSKLCVSYDFEKNEARAGYNGRVSELVKNPDTADYMKGTFDGRSIADAPPNTQFLLILGRYWYDENPFIGSMANVNVWSRTMEETELADRTRCDKSVMDAGNLVNGNSFWKLTARLVTRMTIPDSEALCSKAKMKINAFLPVTQLTR